MRISELFEAKKKPKPGLFVGVKLSADSKKKIAKYIQDAEIPNACSVDDMHCTVLYSRKPCPDYKPPGRYDKPLVGKPGKFEVWDNRDKTRNVLVLTLNSPDLAKLHKKLMKDHPATYDFPEYKAHVTFSYDFGDKNVKDLDPIDFRLEFDEEYDDTVDNV